MLERAQQGAGHGPVEQPLAPEGLVLPVAEQAVDPLDRMSGLGRAGQEAPQRGQAQAVVLQQRGHRGHQSFETAGMDRGECLGEGSVQELDGLHGLGTLFLFGDNQRARPCRPP